jgi:TetR/AcrR family tetracycline transcriptional repressor
MVSGGFTPVLALRTISALAYYVNGFARQELASRQEDAEQPPDQLAELAEQLDGGVSAPLLVAIHYGGSPLGEAAFEHGLRALIDGTAAALARQRLTRQVR